MVAGFGLVELKSHPGELVTPLLVGLGDVVVILFELNILHIKLLVLLLELLIVLLQHGFSLVVFNLQLVNN